MPHEQPGEGHPPCLATGQALAALADDLHSAGIALTLANSKMVQASVAAATEGDTGRKKPVVLNTAVRLAIITAAALAIAFAFRPEGLGVMFGLALGQVIVVLSTVIPVMRGLRKQS